MNCCNKEAPKNSNICSKDLEGLEGLICYCFKYSKQELYDAIQSGQEDKFLNEIKLKMKDPGCFCETANPSGKCCLLDIKNFIKKTR